MSNLLNFTKVECNHFSFTVTEDWSKQDTGFHHKQLTVGGIMSTVGDKSVTITVVDNHGSLVQLVFLADEVGESHKITLDEVSFRITFEEITEDKRLETCIQKGGWRFKVDVD